MDFKKKTIGLLSILGILIIAYILTFVFSPESSYKRGSQWTPFEDKTGAYTTEQIIEINKSIKLVKELDKWYVDDDANQRKLPAKTARIEDLLKALETKGNYPVRSKNPDSFKNFGLDADSAQSIFIEDGDSILAGFYFGNTDVGSREIYLRRVDGALEDTSGVRSGEDIFSTYLSGNRTSWTDTRLFKNHDANGLTVDSIQTVEVQLNVTSEDNSPIKAKEDYTLIRGSNNTWKFSQDPKINVDSSKVESLLRSALDAEADDYAPVGFEEKAVLGKLVLIDDKGASHTISLGDKLNGKYRATVSDDKENGNDFTYLLSDWSVQRLFPAKESLYGAEQKE